MWCVFHVKHAPHYMKVSVRMSELYQLNKYVWCISFTYNNNTYRICIDTSNGNMFIQQLVDDIIVDDITIDDIIQ